MNLSPPVASTTYPKQVADLYRRLVNSGFVDDHNFWGAAWREADDLRAHPFRHLEGEVAPAYARFAFENVQAFQAAQAAVCVGSDGGRCGEGDAVADGRGLPSNLASLVTSQFGDWTPRLSQFGNGMDQNKATLDALLGKMKSSSSTADPACVGLVFSADAQSASP